MDSALHYGPTDIAQSAGLDYDPISIGNLQSRFGGFEVHELEAMQASVRGEVGTNNNKNNVAVVEQSKGSSASSRTLRDLQQGDTTSALGQAWQQHWEQSWQHLLLQPCSLGATAPLFSGTS